MSVTSFSVSESYTTSFEAQSLDGGEICIVGEFDLGSVSDVYTISNTDQISAYLGSTTSKVKRIMKWLIEQENVLRVIRVGSGTAATGTLSYASSSDEDSDSEESSNILTVTAKGPGSEYDNISIKITSSGSYFNFYVYYSDTLVESFTALSLDPTNVRYYGVMLKSNYVDVVINEDVVTELSLLESTIQLSGGDMSDISESDYVTAIEYLHDRDILFSTLLIPTFASLKDSLESVASIKSALYSLIEERQDFVYCAEIDDEISDLSPIGITSYDDDYVALAYPSVFLSVVGDYVDSSVLLASAIGNVSRKKLWYKDPAGVIYGTFGSSGIYVKSKLTKTEIEELQEARVVPVTIKIGYGVTLWGDTTFSDDELAVNYIGTRVLLNYLKRVVYIESQRFFFMENTQITWNLWIDTIEPYITAIYDAGGINDYRITCGTSTMTDQEILDGIMKATIVIWPVSYIHEIYITFTIDKAGSTFDTEEE